MEWKLSEERFKQYSEALTAAREAEANLGSITYKIHQLSNLRQEIDKSLKDWWEEVIVEMKLDKGKNYMIDKDGLVKDMPSQTENAPAQPVAPANPVIIENTVDDL